MSSEQKFSVDVDSLMESYQKGVEAMSTATRMAAETLQTLSTLQSRYMKESLEELGGTIRELMASTPQTRSTIAKRAMQQGLERAVTHSKTLAQQWSESNKTVAESLGKQVGESILRTQNAFAQGSWATPPRGQQGRNEQGSSSQDEAGSSASSTFFRGTKGGESFRGPGGGL